MREEKEGFPDREREDRLLSRFERMRREGTFRYMDVAEYEEIVDAYLDKGQFDKAEQTVRIALRQHPSAFLLILKKAEIHLARADYLPALEVLNPLTRLDPSNYEVFLLRGIALVHMEREQEALEDFDQALSLGAGIEGDIAFQAATELELTGYYGTALKYMKQAYEYNPYDIQALFELAFLYHQAGREKEAIGLYEKYLREEPFDEGGWNNLGEVYLAAGRYEDALEAFEYQLAIQPASPDGLFNKGKVLMLLERYPQAIAVLKDYLDRSPDDVEAMLLLGRSYHRSGEERRALSWFKVAAGENPGDPEPCYYAAHLYRLLGETEEAGRCCMKSLEIDPENPVFLYELFLIREKSLSPGERLKLIRNVVGKDPSNISYWLDYLLLLLEMRALNDLEEALEDARRHHQDHPMLQYVKAVSLLLQGKKTEGTALFEEALEKYYEGHEVFLERFPGLLSLHEVNLMIRKYKL